MPNCAYCGVHRKGPYTDSYGVDLMYYCDDYCFKADNNLDADPFEKYRLKEIES